jgi:hypothetical protein
VKNHHRRRWLALGLTPREAKFFERLHRVYGLMPDDYDRLLNKQGGRCAICQAKTPKRRGISSDRIEWCVDHDHRTGKVRGLLCYACNAALGCLDDDIDLFESAIHYLVKGGA